MSFRGSTAIVSGGTRGIGRAICLELARQGCNIAFNYASSKAHAASLALEISEIGARSMAFQISVTDQSGEQCGNCERHSDITNERAGLGRRNGHKSKRRF